MANINDTLVIRPELISRLKSALNDQHYHDAITNSSKYNAKLVSERKLRLPFLDAQTGVAQSDSFIWMSKVERMPGHTEEQLYSYPAKRWRKKRRQYLMNDNYLTRRNRESEMMMVSVDNHETIITTVENGKPAPENGDNMEKFQIDDSKESWLRDFDDGSDLPDAGELDDPESDYDDYEEYSTRKSKKKKKETPKRKRVEYSDAEKPYSCDICGARYKTRPGLSYHYSHSHQNDSAGNCGSNSGLRGEEEEMAYTPPRQIHHQTPLGPQTSSMTSNTQLQSSSIASMPLLSSQLSGQQPFSSQSQAGQSSSHSRPPSSLKSTNGEDSEGGPKSSGNQPASPSQYCDFCLGDSIENKKTKSAEDLVSCSDCGRSAHPTCLQFTPNMIISVKKYKWQCIECKSCGLCGTSDNDDQLLFCDDCDRGYHMYCLKPPLSEPPEGSWSCHLCIEEYHTPKK